MAIRKSEIRRIRRELITRTARVWSRLNKTLLKDLNEITQTWLKKFFSYARQNIADGSLSSAPEFPEKFNTILLRTLREALAQGYWLEYLYFQEMRSAYNGRKYRGKISLADNYLSDEKLRKLLKIFIAAKATAEILEEWYDIIPVNAIDWLNNYVPKLAEIFNNAVLEKTRDTIQKSLLEGSTLRERMKELQNISTELSTMAKSRIEAIARTEITRADTMGRLIAMKSNPDVIGVEFSAVMDDRTTEICASRHGLIMRLDDPRLPYNAPPLHVNCRSVLSSVTIYEYPNGISTSAEFDEVPESKQRPEDIEEIKKILQSKTENSINIRDEVLKTGALTDRTDPDYSQREKHAKTYYDELRNSKSEFVIEKLSQNGGVSIKTAQKIYEHIFINEYELYDEIKRFDPSYDMAESIQRILQNDNIQEHDIILLHHERLEYELMNRYGKDYDAAHKLTCKKYDYPTALEKWKKETGH